MHHILQRLSVLKWVYNYSREQAAYPVKQNNSSGSSIEIDNVYGDRNLMLLFKLFW